LVDSGCIHLENAHLETAYRETGFCGTLRLLAVIPPLDSLGSGFNARVRPTLLETSPWTRPHSERIIKINTPNRKSQPFATLF
jgi:hypothetical protein